MTARYKFIAQMFFTSLVMGLCLYKLVDNKTTPEQQALYWGGLSGILGYWLPSPGDRGRQDEQLTLRTGEVTDREAGTTAQISEASTKSKGN